MSLTRKGLNILISAPSGVGKSTLIKQIVSIDNNLKFAISVTTRPKRPQEVDGINYYFKSTEEFYELINTNAFIEYAEVFGNFYGTLHSEAQKNLNSGKDTIFDLDWQGASILKSKMPEDTISIFILPPSLTELERRIRVRNQDAEDVILYRMAKSRSEISHYSQYDYIIINDDLTKATNEIQSIILANRLRKDKFNNMNDFIKNL